MHAAPVSLATAPSQNIATAELQIGMFVHLDLGWMSHPFALSSFRIADAEQIAMIRGLGLAKVRWSPEQSDTALRGLGKAAASAQPGVVPASRAAAAPARSPLAAHRDSTELAQRQYAEAARDWRNAADLATRDPTAAGARLTALSQALLDKMLDARELSIRTVAAAPSEYVSHALNVGVLALLMGRMCGLSPVELQDLGVGALAHDIGKIELPPALHKADPNFTSAEMSRYRDHVGLGVVLGQRMSLTPGALLVIGQHHEHMDGSGFPQGVTGQRISSPARVCALANRYDNLCHPSRRSAAMTPHEALSLLFSQGQRQYEPALLNTFVRMMGVYPPGSVVQLTDDRYAVVESVSASRPLKPKVQVHDPAAGPGQTALIDLSQQRTLGIRRALPPERVPAEAREHLMSRRRSVWFFEAADDAQAGDAEDELRAG